MLFIALPVHKPKANPYAKQHPSAQLFTLCTVPLFREHKLPEKTEIPNIFHIVNNTAQEYINLSQVRRRYFMCQKLLIPFLCYINELFHLQL